MPPRRLALAAPSRLVPTYYNVSRNNSHIALPTNDRRRITYNRLRSFTGRQGTLYVFKVDDSVPEQDRQITINAVDYPADFVVTFRPRNSDKQQWVAVNSVTLEEVGKRVDALYY